MNLDRRTFLGGSAAAVAASGDPLPDRVILWSRVTSDRDVPVTSVVA